MKISEIKKQMNELEIRLRDATTEEELKGFEMEYRKLNLQYDVALRNQEPKNIDDEAIEDGINYRGRDDRKLLQQSNSNKKRNINDDNLEYRKAFKDFIVFKKSIPMEFRDSTLTNDVETVIPENLSNQIIEKMKSFGFILPLVTRTSNPVGQTIPKILSRPIATWTSEDGTSDKQKTTTGKIIFTNHKLRCEISFSKEVSVMSLEVFEEKFIEMVGEAMTIAIEEAIINGKEDAESPTGILAKLPTDEKNIKLTKWDYSTLSKAESLIPQNRTANVKWAMPRATFYNNIIGMTDNNGQPVARVNYGIGTGATEMILGREVVFMGDYLRSDNPVKAFLFNFKDYVYNTNYNMGIMKREQWENENQQYKAVTSGDGQVIYDDTLIVITSGNSKNTNKATTEE